MNFNKIRSFCSVFRTVVGLALIAYGVYTIINGTPNYWFFLGLLPLAAGLFKFCPLCMISKQCDLPNNKK